MSNLDVLELRLQLKRVCGEWIVTKYTERKNKEKLRWVQIYFFFKYTILFFFYFPQKNKTFPPPFFFKPHQKNHF